MLPITTPGYVFTSPYTTVQVPLSRPVSVMPGSLMYEPSRTTLIQTAPQMFYTNMVDSYISQQTSVNASDKAATSTTATTDVKLFDPIAVNVQPQFIQPVVYTSVVGDLISQQSFLNAERTVDEKINKTVHAQIQKYHSDKFKEEEYKRRLLEQHEQQQHHNRCGGEHHSHEHHSHEHHDQHNHHHHHRVERTQGSQTDLSLNGLTLKDDKLCCCTGKTGHKIPVCDDCVCNHTDCCLEDKIRRIRRELHLPNEGCSTNTGAYQHDHREIVTPDKPKVTFTNKKYEVDIAEIDRPSRSRSKSRTCSSGTSTADRPRSRSLSANSRPLWKPTGANDYTWTHQTRSDILNGEYKAQERAYKRSRSQDKANQASLLPSEVHYMYPIQTVNQYEYHEIPVQVETVKTRHCGNHRSRSNSKPRSGSPLPWRSTNKNDYNWTAHSVNNYDSMYNSAAKPTIVNSGCNKRAGNVSEVYYSVETVRPKTSVDHFYSKNSCHTNNPSVHYHTFESTKPVQTDYYYYETKPNNSVKSKVRFNSDKATSTSTSNAIATQTYADKGASTSLEYSRDQNNRYSVYIK